MADAGNAYIERKREEAFVAEFAELLKPIIKIGSNGNWYIDGKDTGIKAQGPQGSQGIEGTPFDDIIGDFTVATSAWKSDATYADMGYGYKAEITIAGHNIDASKIPEVMLPPAAIASGVIAPFCETGTDKIILYATAVPGSAFTIERVTVRRNMSL